MNIEELIKEIKSSMKNKNSLLYYLESSKEPFIYLFKDTQEYDFLHSLAENKVLKETIRSEEVSVFSINENRLNALRNPEEYFGRLENA